MGKQPLLEESGPPIGDKNWKLIDDQWVKTAAATKSGRGFNGAHRDAGTIVHAVPQNKGGDWFTPALCGTEPGIRGNGWHKSDAAVTCQRCLKKVAS